MSRRPRHPLPCWRRWLAFALVAKIIIGAAWLAFVFGGVDGFLYLWSGLAVVVLVGAWRQAGEP
jgi:hypothetical protein